jgi:flavin reductase (DIM6/NTAB) family NADH-FMN oxidoreductase RutF
MIIDLSEKSPTEIYYTLIQSIIPRPIAWVLSDNGNGTNNLAPFSYFSGVSSKPPIVSISVGPKNPGHKKDTWRNIEERKNFVIHIAHEEMAEAVTASSASLADGQSEIDHLGLETIPVENWPLPRLKECRIALLCEKFAIHEIGKAPMGLILGNVKAVYLDNTIITTENNRLKIDAKKLNPLARLGGDDYTTLGNIITIKRPE